MNLAIYQTLKIKRMETRINNYNIGCGTCYLEEEKTILQTHKMSMI